MKSYYFSIYSGYNMLSGRRSASENAKKLTWMHFKVTMYNTLEWHKKISYIYRTFIDFSIYIMILHAILFYKFDILCRIRV